MKLKDLKKLLKGKDNDDVDLSSIFPAIKETVVQPISTEIATEIPTESPAMYIKHSTNLGDMIASLICVKKYYEVTGRKVIFCQRINMPGAYYPGAIHPTKSDDGTQVTLNQTMFDLIKPLIESQEYIERMEEYRGQHCPIDFDVIRGKTFVNMPHGSIQGWLMFAFPDLAADISKPWMSFPQERQQIEEVTKGKIIVNFTERYRNTILEYHFLKEYSADLIFSGTEVEHFKFCSQFGLTIPRLEIKNFLELAYAVRACRFTLSNQSFLWNLATAMGKPRMLEVCQFAQNCMPFYGEHNIGYFHQISLGYWFRVLYNTIK